MMRIPLVLAWLALLTGCAIEQSTYYKPLGPGSYLRSCGRGIRDSLVLEISRDLTVDISAVGAWDKDYSSRSLEAISFGYYLRPGHSLTLEDQFVEVTLGQAEESVRIPFDSVGFTFYRQPNYKKPFSDPEIDKPTNGEMTRKVQYTSTRDDGTYSHESYSFPAVQTFYGAHDHMLPPIDILYAEFQHFRHYGAQIKLPNGQPRSILVKLPRIAIDGNITTMAPIRIDQVTETNYRGTC